MRMTPFVSLAIVLTLTACSSSRFDTRSGPAPLSPQPTGRVSAQPLPPPVTPDAAALEAPTEVAVAEAPAVQDPATATEVRKADLSGGWTIASAGENCQLFMNLTTWTGGYRANTRGCTSDELKSVGAWDLNGKEVVLKDASGSPVARLYASSTTRFSGQTVVSSRGVQVFR